MDIDSEMSRIKVRPQNLSKFQYRKLDPNDKFVDFGSIVPAKTDSGQLSWPYKEFQDFFLYPLYLMSADQGELARRLLFDLNNIASKQAIIRLLPWTRQVQCRWNDLFNNPYKLRSMEAFLQQLRRSPLDFYPETRRICGP